MFDFNRHNFEAVSNEVKNRAFWMSPQKWIEQMNAIGIISKAGRYDSGTFAHKDIAFKFASWLSVEFEFYIIKEFQRLKEAEQAKLQWSAKRELARVNFHLQTSAIAEHIIVPTLTEKQKLHAYTDEADLLNVVLFGKTAKEWRDQNPDKDHAKENMRDFANYNQLFALSTLEALNSVLIKEKMPQAKRMTELSNVAKQQLQNLAKIDSRLLLPKN